MYNYTYTNFGVYKLTEKTMQTNEAIKQVYRNSPSDGDRPYAMLEILRTRPKWTHTEYEDFIDTFWLMSNNVTEHYEAWREVLENYYPPALRFKKPKKSIRIYRGATSPDGFSWTTDFEIARKFAIRNSDSYFSNDGKQSTIWQAEVKPSGILFKSNGRGEKEVVVKFWTNCFETRPVDVIEIYKLRQKYEQLA